VRHEYLRRYGGWAALVLACCGYFFRFIKDPVGTVVYTRGAECLLAGEPLIECSKQVAPEFPYPPAFALFMTPFVPLSPMWRNIVWYLISITATVGSYVIAEKLARRLFPGDWSEHELAWLRIVGVLLSVKFALNVLEWQAYDTVVLFIILASLWALANGRELAAGGGLALAAALKATPLIFLPYLVLRRRVAAAIVFTAVLVLLSFAPDILFFMQGKPSAFLETWFREVAAAGFFNDPATAKTGFLSGWMDAHPSNQSLRGAVTRIMYPTALREYAEKVIYLADALCVLAIGAVIAKSPRDAGGVAIDGSLLLIAILMLSPMTSRYHYVVLLLPYMVLAAAVVRDRATRGIGVAVLALSFVLVTATTNDLSGRWLTDVSYQYNFWIVGSLLLLVYFAILVKHIADRESRDERLDEPPIIQATGGRPEVV
jgi:hypothetical protein